MAWGQATDLVVQNQIIQQHQNFISQHQISQIFHLAQSTVCVVLENVLQRLEKAAMEKLLVGS